MSTENKPLCIIRGPVATRSGYGDMSRDIVRHIIEYDKYDVKVHSVGWGDTPMNALDETNPKDKMILDRILKGPVNKQPDLFIVISVPNEFEALGKFNIGITAGIETTACSPQWLEGCNKMNAVFTISNHSKLVFEHSKYQIQLPNGTTNLLELKTPIDVLHNCIDTNIFNKKAPLVKTLVDKINEIPETYSFLFVGHWLRGDIGEDRKNVGLLIKLFYEAFKQVTDKPKPALILKTSSAGFSILDREEILSKIQQIKKTVSLEGGQVLPNVYLLHGELTDHEMNTLYNHPKIKTHISLTKGEGFGRPLLEASVSGKPVIASGWSGLLDFLDKDTSMLIGGELKPVHDSSVWEGVIMKESQWFAPDAQMAVNAMASAFYDYTTYKNNAYVCAERNRKNFNYESIRQKTFDLLDKYVPEFPKQMSLVLPKLKKIEKKSE